MRRLTWALLVLVPLALLGCWSSDKDRGQKRDRDRPKKQESRLDGNRKLAPAVSAL
jgi:hypothetical protein